MIIEQTPYLGHVPERVFLTDEERNRAVDGGAARHDYATRRGLKHRRGAEDENSLAYHIIGALGEFAVCKFLMIPWDPTIGQTGGDDLPGVEIKAAGDHGLNLLIPRNANPNKYYVLVTVEGNEAQIHGYISGYKAMIPDRLTEIPNGRPPVYLIPQDELADIVELAIDLSMHGEIKPDPALYGGG